MNHDTNFSETPWIFSVQIILFIFYEKKIMLIEIDMKNRKIKNWHLFFSFIWFRNVIEIRKKIISCDYCNFSKIISS